jgi:hypothetical protein
MPCPELASAARRFWVSASSSDTLRSTAGTAGGWLLVAAVMEPHVRARRSRAHRYRLESHDGVDFTPSAPTGVGVRTGSRRPIPRSRRRDLPEQLKAELAERGLPMPRSTGSGTGTRTTTPEEERRPRGALA